MSVQKEAFLKKLLGLEDTMEKIVEREQKQREKIIKQLEEQEENKKKLAEKIKKLEEEMDKTKKALDPLTNLSKTINDAKEKALKMLYGKDDLQMGTILKVIEKVKGVYRKDLDELRTQIDKAKKTDKHGVFNKDVNKKINRSITRALQFTHPEHEKAMRDAFKTFAKKCEIKVPGKPGEVGGIMIGGFPRAGTLKFQSASENKVNFKWYDPDKLSKLLTQGVFSTSWFKASVNVVGELAIDANRPSFFKLYTLGKKNPMFHVSTFNPKRMTSFVKPKVVESAAARKHKRTASQARFNLRQATLIHLSHHPELKKDVMPLLSNKTASASDLRGQMIRLAYAKKELRPHLVPLVVFFG